MEVNRLTLIAFVYLNMLRYKYFLFDLTNNIVLLSKVFFVLIDSMWNRQERLDNMKSLYSLFYVVNRDFLLQKRALS